MMLPEAMPTESYCLNAALPMVGARTPFSAALENLMFAHGRPVFSPDWTSSSASYCLFVDDVEVMK